MSNLRHDLGTPGRCSSSPTGKAQPRRSPRRSARDSPIGECRPSQTISLNPRQRATGDPTRARLPDPPTPAQARRYSRTTNGQCDRRPTGGAPTVSPSALAPTAHQSGLSQPGHRRRTYSPTPPAGSSRWCRQIEPWLLHGRPSSPPHGRWACSRPWDTREASETIRTARPRTTLSAGR